MTARAAAVRWESVPPTTSKWGDQSCHIHYSGDFSGVNQWGSATVSSEPLVTNYYTVTKTALAANGFGLFKRQVDRRKVWRESVGYGAPRLRPGPTRDMTVTCSLCISTDEETHYYRLIRSVLKSISPLWPSMQDNLSPYFTPSSERAKSRVQELVAITA